VRCFAIVPVPILAFIPTVVKVVVSARPLVTGLCGAATARISNWLINIPDRQRLCCQMFRAPAVGRFAQGAGPRFNGECPLSPAAGPTPVIKNAGSSITATCASVRFRSAPAFPRRPPVGLGLWVLPAVAPRGTVWGHCGHIRGCLADFDAAWKVYLPRCTEADFEEYRRPRASSAWEYAMHDAGLALPAQRADGQSRCFCGVTIDITGVTVHVYAAHRTVAHPT
jgi:hypothetical protein